MLKGFLQKLVVIASASSFVVTSAANAHVYIDPDAYNCSVELKNTEFGRLNARVFAHKKRGIQRVEGEWRSSSRSPLINANWSGRDFGRGSVSVVYLGIVSDMRVRFEIGACSGNDRVCGMNMHYATDFRATEGTVYAGAPWGVITSIGLLRGDIYFYIQDEAGAVIREDKIPVATLLAVEREMNRLMDIAEKRAAEPNNKC